MGLSHILVTQPLVCFVILISFWIIGFTQKIIYARIIKPCKLNEDSGGNVVFPRFVFGISRLGHSEHFCYLCLV